MVTDPIYVLKATPCFTTSAALFLPTSGIIDPTVLVYKLHHLAAENGAQFLTATRLTDVKPHPD